jgi:hypothetical protein
MEPSAMGRGSLWAYFRCPAHGLGLAVAESLDWSAPMAPNEKLRAGRSIGLGWLPFEERMQQPTERWFWRRWDVGEAMRQGGTCRGGRLPIIWVVELSNLKIKIERATGPWFFMASSGWGTQQPTESRHNRLNIVFWKGSQDVDDGGGHCRIVSTVELRGKKN